MPSEKGFEGSYVDRTDLSDQTAHFLQSDQGFCCLLTKSLDTTEYSYITKTRLFKYIENFTTKNWKFSDKNSNIFNTSAQNIDCGYSLGLPHQGSSNEYPQSMFLSRNKKNNVYPCKPQFYCIKVGI